MSRTEEKSVWKYYILGGCIIVLFGALGHFMGIWVVGYGRDEVAVEVIQQQIEAGELVPVEPEEKIVWPEPSLYISLPIGDGKSREAFSKRISEACSNIALQGEEEAPGMRRFILETSLPWLNAESSHVSILSAIEDIAAASSEAEILLSINLDPPAAWLQEHADAVVTIGDKKLPCVSVASEQWRSGVRELLGGIIESVKSHDKGSAVKGYVLRCLKDGMWIQPDGYDRSKDNAKKFSDWLTVKYETTDAIRAAWEDNEVTVETAAVPKEKNVEDGGYSFFSIPKERRYLDYLKYASENTAETIALFASYIKSISGPDTRIYAAYGMTFALTANSAGHSALGRLMDSEIDGFITPAEYAGSSLEQAGAISGPVHSALRNGKEWLLIDSSFMDGAKTNEETAAENIHAKRDHIFAVALAQNMGIIWPVPLEDTPALDEGEWNAIKSLKNIYSPSRGEKPREGLKPFGSNEEIQLTVVVDEASRNLLSNEDWVNALSLQQLSANAFGAGTPFQVCMMSDLLAGSVALTDFYLFLNSYILPESHRELLHTILLESEATAIWVYAPGYCNGENNSSKNISDTVKMNVKPFDDPINSGSVITLGGKWIKAGAEYGTGKMSCPMYYIDEDDESVNVIARYKDSGKISLAIAFIGENNGDEIPEAAAAGAEETDAEASAGNDTSGGAPSGKSWTSVYCAEPSMPVALLREILSILEMKQFYPYGPKNSREFTHVGNNVLAIHPMDDGDRSFDLGALYNVADLLQPEVGWPEKRNLGLKLNKGETRLFKLMPLKIHEEDAATEQSDEMAGQS